ncbi:MAG: DUF3592 domain-containing protein [Lentisphaeria bacterium]|nr:DUF3592 domain-containing protein [Lentisphaeria bacterium]
MKLTSEELANLRGRVANTPLVAGGGSFATHWLDCSNPERWIFKLNLKLKLFIGLFQAVGAAVMISVIFSDADWATRLFLLFFGGFFSGISTIVYCCMTKKIGHFDFTESAFWQGRINREAGHNLTREKNYLPFAELAALQIVSEYCVSSGKNKSRYFSYELNLVTTDGRRINVVDHGNLAQLESDAGKLAEKLDLPLWEEAEAAEHWKKSGSFSWWQRLEMVLFGLVFFAAGAFFEYMLIIGPYLKYQEAAAWEKVPAKVVASELTPGGEVGCYKINIQYSYNYGKENYKSDNFDLFFRPNFSTNVNVNEMRQLLADYPAGREFNCMVNPANPAEALGVRALRFSWFDLFPLIFVAVGLAILTGGLFGKRTSGQKR